MENKETSLVAIGNLPDLHEAKTSPRELSSDYWTPELDGEYRVGVIMDIKEETYENEAGEKIQLPCIIMLSQNKDKTFSTIRNGSKRLVGTVEGAVENGEIVLGETPVRIEYLGKTKNKTNSFKSDRWSVKPILLKSK